MISLKELLNILRDINIQKLIKLSSMSNETLKLMEGKNMYMLMGLKGSGKTTTLNTCGPFSRNSIVLISIVSDLTFCVRFTTEKVWFYGM